jgi:hypothetical protein
VGNNGDVTATGKFTIGVYVKTCTPPATPTFYDCFCNGSDPAIGGGTYVNSGAGAVRENRPGNVATAWRVTCVNTSFADMACPLAYAVCLSHGN